VSNRKLIAEEIVEALRRHPACTFETLVAECSEFTWDQLFSEVDRMRGLGELRLTPGADGRYVIRLPRTDDLQEIETVPRTRLLNP
jgi:hypothetical protein